MCEKESILRVLSGGLAMVVRRMSGFISAAPTGTVLTSDERIDLSRLQAHRWKRWRYNIISEPSAMTAGPNEAAATGPTRDSCCRELSQKPRGSLLL